ncbi:hypothetical protein J7394_17090 [Ruegeria sp. R13_0]|uniref:hypothetical protein n=1 Tax=Ruegeria sp. R13_0 TaxID=2821099 RepID=UPI001ADBDC54|nr:hypothetical protein [Ruegeria sp. R13_0]MBO9435940.1 hypothetical protein [Ruegeria sp. R13_0]
MGIHSSKLKVIAAAVAVQLVGVTAAQAACTVSTARKAASSPEVLCECSAVTSGMIRYIQRRADFGNYLARTGAECPQLAALLSDIPTASTGLAEQRSGDGNPDGNPENGGGPSDPSDGPGGGDSGPDDKGGDDGKKGGDDGKKGGDDSKKGGDDSKKGGDDSKKGGDDSKKGGDDSKKGGDDSKKGGDDSKKGGDTT